MKNFYLGWCVVIVASCSVTNTSKDIVLRAQSLQSADDVMALFPKTVDEIHRRTAQIKQDITNGMATILGVPSQEKTFENTAFALDRLAYRFKIEAELIAMLEHVSPDKAIRNASHEVFRDLQYFAIDIFSNNIDLYKAFRFYVDKRSKKENLDDVQRYFLQEEMKGFKRSGFHLPDEEREKVAALDKQLSELSLAFSRNIAEGQRSITVEKEGLLGVDDDFIASLHRDEKGLYVLMTDYPTVSMVMGHCAVEDTRQRLYLAFNQRAYPENMPLLDEIIAKRDERSRIVGFESYADYDLDNQMVKTVDRAQEFIQDLIKKVRTKEEQEFELWKVNLPEGVTLADDGTIKPWDAGYIIEQYRKKTYDLDDRKIAEYFPTEHTIEGILDIYEQFFCLTFKEVYVVHAWHSDVKVIEVYERGSEKIRGYLILDLYPREGKFSHAAKFSIIESIRQDGIIQPAVACVVANFPRATATKPSLLTHSDVTTFFHEFGHAIHHVLASTKLASFSGTQVKRDFVELPSQLLEEWMWDKVMLKRVSRHYNTGAPLPDSMIETMIAVKNLSSGFAVLRQMFYAMLSLEYFKAGAKKNTDAIFKKLYRDITSHVTFIPEAHMQAAFGHLTDYGAKYYGYMWTKVFALDVFETIKNEDALLDPRMGQRLSDTILSKGGSVEPDQLLQAFLQREPNQEAFLRDLGLQ